MAIEKFRAVYIKRDGKYLGYVELLGDAHASGRTLAEVKAKLRAAIPEALRKRRRNMIRGKASVSETIAVEVKP